MGHLRNTLIGHSLDKVYRWLGHNVISVNHLGDWGTQFGFIWVGSQIWGEPDNTNIHDLVDLYIRASALKKEQEQAETCSNMKNYPDAVVAAREYFKLLEAGDPEATRFWQHCYDVSLEYIEEVERRLGIDFTYHTGESFYRDKLEQVTELLKQANILEESRGALGVNLGDKLGFVRVMAEDGRSLYKPRANHF